MVKYLIKLSRWLLLLLVVIFFAVQVPSTFLTFDNISNVLRVSAFLVILALGQGIVIISGNGGIDLSNGSVAALSSCISALMISGGVNIILAVIVGLLVGAGIGLVNGLLVSVVKLPPFVATYGMDSAVRGAAYILMSGTIVYGVFPDSFRFMGSGTLFGIGVPIYIAAICAVVLSCSPAFAAVVNSIPAAIIGGVSFILYGMISAIGVRNVVENRVDFTNSRNLIIAAVILVCGLGFTNGITFAIGEVHITLTNLAVAAIAGIALNAILPGKDYTFGADVTEGRAGDFGRY